MRGLYVITDPELIRAEQLVSEVAAAIKGGAKMVQYRNKIASSDERLWQAQDLQTLCKGLGVPLLINDDVELAHKVKAAGVHLGQTDVGIEKARGILGQAAIIGLSCHSDIEIALKAQDKGADYVAFGRFFSSHTKPSAPPAKLEVLTKAKACLNIPLVAIGGINQDNAASLIGAGADMLAVIHRVFGAADIENSAKLIASQF